MVHDFEEATRRHKGVDDVIVFENGDGAAVKESGVTIRDVFEQVVSETTLDRALADCARIDEVDLVKTVGKQHGFIDVDVAVIRQAYRRRRDVTIRRGENKPIAVGI